MGVVYLARDPILDRQVAIKVLPAALSSDEERLKRFLREHAFRCVTAHLLAVFPSTARRESRWVMRKALDTNESGLRGKERNSTTSASAVG